MDNLLQYIKQLPYWKDLTPTEKDLVQSHTSLQTYKKGEVIGGIGNNCLGMILVIHGMLRAYMLSEEGREITLFRLYEGDSCVMSAACAIRQITFDTEMTAQQDTLLLVVGPGAYRTLTSQNIYVRCFTYELITERFSSVMWSMQEILFKGYDRRLAAFLIQEYDRTGSSELRMTHEQIAQQTSSAREVAARMLKRFAAEDWVEISRGRIKIKDPESLRALI